MAEKRLRRSMEAYTFIRYLRMRGRRVKGHAGFPERLVELGARTKGRKYPGRGKS